MSRPSALALPALALAVVAGPLGATAYAAGGGGGAPGAPGAPGQNGSQPPAASGSTEQQTQQPPKGPAQGDQGDDAQPEFELDGTYSGQVVHTTQDVSSKPTAAPVTAFEMPFPCGEVWTGTTRSGHSPSVRSIDWNRSDDFQDPVVAAADGVVTTAVTGKKRPSYGQFVVIDHGNGESSLYGHLDSVTVVVGQAVTAGTQIGNLGNTGNSHGAHLHFEERKGSSVIDSWFHGSRYVFGSAQASTNCGRVAVPDVPLAGQVVGDKRAELVLFRRTDTPAFLVRRQPRPDKVMAFGNANDQPLLGDWNGDGKATPGVWRSKKRTFLLKQRNQITTIRFGSRSDIGVVGDWDGDGTWQVGTRRPTTNEFRLRGANGRVTKVRLGDSDDLPVTGDWDGDGVTDLGVYDSATATFTLRRVDDTGMEWLSQATVGEAGDLPVVGDWDANGFTDLGAWDPETATFVLVTAPTPTTQGKKHRKVKRVAYGVGG